MEHHCESILKTLWQTSFGQRVYAWELDTLRRMAKPVLGVTGLEMGYPIEVLSEKSASGCLFRTNTYKIETESFLGFSHNAEKHFAKEPFYLWVDPTALPFQSQSFDVISASHILDTHDNPEIILRELYRVLCPNGVLMLTLFNPYSWVRFAPWLYHQLSHDWSRLNAIRLQGWLKLLGLTVEQACFGVYMLPYQQSYQSKPFCKNFRENLRKKKEGFTLLDQLDLMGQRWWPLMGSVVVITARKRVFHSALVGGFRWSYFQAEPDPVVASS